MGLMTGLVNALLLDNFISPDFHINVMETVLQRRLLVLSRSSSAVMVLRWLFVQIAALFLFWILFDAGAWSGNELNGFRTNGT